ncbi:MULTISPECIES: hypothetical protein [Sphingobacterium]|uniref:hypothetical protein n=1 Tax=Sphingobacterium TaxID=28453 RepID=UPI00257A7DED|nr:MULTISPECIES: hypothetical protein [Sphingobacterium]
MYKAWYDNPYLTAYEKVTPELINKMNAALTLNYKVSDWGKLNHIGVVRLYFAFD